MASAAVMPTSEAPSASPPPLLQLLEALPEDALDCVVDAVLHSHSRWENVAALPLDSRARSVSRKALASLLLLNRSLAQRVRELPSARALHLQTLLDATPTLDALIRATNPSATSSSASASASFDSNAAPALHDASRETDGSANPTAPQITDSDNSHAQHAGNANADKAEDEGLVYELPWLRRLCLDAQMLPFNRERGEAVLGEVLRRCPGLRVLCLPRWTTDALLLQHLSLQQLADSLHTLDLCGSGVSDRALAAVGRLAALRCLGLAGCQLVTARGVAALVSGVYDDDNDWAWRPHSSSGSAGIRTNAIASGSGSSGGRAAAASVGDGVLCMGLQQLDLGRCYALDEDAMPYLQRLRRISWLSLAGLGFQMERAFRRADAADPNRCLPSLLLLPPRADSAADSASAPAAAGTGVGVRGHSGRSGEGGAAPTLSAVHAAAAISSAATTPALGCPPVQQPRAAPPLCHMLFALDLSDCRALRDATLQLLPPNHLPRLQQLRLRNCTHVGAVLGQNGGGGALAAVALAAPALRLLDLGGCSRSLSDVTLLQLAPLRQLERLAIGPAWAITDFGVATLVGEHLTRLTALSCAGCRQLSRHATSIAAIRRGFRGTSVGSSGCPSAAAAHATSVVAQPVGTDATAAPPPPPPPLRP